jgi:hypothetical protein
MSFKRTVLIIKDVKLDREISLFPHGFLDKDTLIKKHSNVNGEYYEKAIILSEKLNIEKVGLLSVGSIIKIGSTIIISKIDLKNLEVKNKKNILNITDGKKDESVEGVEGENPGERIGERIGEWKEDFEDEDFEEEDFERGKLELININDALKSQIHDDSIKIKELEKFIEDKHLDFSNSLDSEKKLGLYHKEKYSLIKTDIEDLTEEYIQLNKKNICLIEEIKIQKRDILELSNILGDNRLKFDTLISLNLSSTILESLKSGFKIEYSIVDLYFKYKNGKIPQEDFIEMGNILRLEKDSILLECNTLLDKFNCLINL